MITMRQLHLRLNYNPTTGVFTRLVAGKGRHRVGLRVGTLRRNGYRQICLDGVIYYEHRLAWLYTFGTRPRRDIDHVNHNRADNRIANLRILPHHLNCGHRAGAQAGSTQKALGIRQKKRGWYVRVVTRGRERHVGVFPTLALAKVAHAKALRTKLAGFGTSRKTINKRTAYVVAVRKFGKG